jgi:hypothetical protein
MYIERGISGEVVSTMMESLRQIDRVASVAEEFLFLEKGLINLRKDLR